MLAAMLVFALLVHPLDHGEALGFLLTGVQVLIGGLVYVGALGFIDPRREADLMAARHRLRRSGVRSTRA